MEKYFDGRKWRRPVMDIPQIVSKLEDVRENILKAQTVEDVKKALEDLTEMVIQSLAHKEELEKALQTMIDLLKNQLNEQNYDALEPVLKDSFQRMDEAGVNEVVEEFNIDVEGLFGDNVDTKSASQPMIGMSLDVDTSGVPEEVFQQPETPAMLHLGKTGHGDGTNEYNPRDVGATGQFQGIEDDLLKEFLGVE